MFSKAGVLNQAPNTPLGDAGDLFLYTYTSLLVETSTPLPPLARWARLCPTFLDTGRLVASFGI